MIIRLGVRRNVVYLILQPHESGLHLLQQRHESRFHIIKSSIGRVKSSIGRVKPSIDRINALLQFADKLEHSRYGRLSSSLGLA